MKFSFSTVLCVLLCAVLVVGAVGVGAVRGWNDERSAVLASLEDGGALHTARENRAMDAMNLCVVAARHLPADDPALVSLRSAADALLNGQVDATRALALDQQLTDAALNLDNRLPGLPSVMASQRDQVYTDMLLAALSPATSLAHGWNELARDFNDRLAGDLIGRLAAALGVEPLPLGQANLTTAN